MAPRQSTFTLVPNPLGIQGLMSRPTNGPQSKPPMTSKQAQKLYREANRGPRLSKAEQRRIELAEQDRIRRELDKEKQANKARVLREKKKAKEQLALEEKKRRGLPLVKVRPSQDTISRFVRGNGAGKKRDSAGAKIDLPVVEEEEGDPKDDRSSTDDEMKENIAPKEVEDAKDCKRRRLDCGVGGDNPSTERQARAGGAEMPAKTRQPIGNIVIAKTHQSGNHNFKDNSEMVGTLLRQSDFLGRGVLMREYRTRKTIGPDRLNRNLRWRPVLELPPTK